MSISDDKIQTIETRTPIVNLLCSIEEILHDLEEAAARIDVKQCAVITAL
jgi:hypothetical protein